MCECKKYYPWAIFKLAVLQHTSNIVAMRDGFVSWNYIMRYVCWLLVNQLWAAKSHIKTNQRTETLKRCAFSQFLVSPLQEDVIGSLWFVFSVGTLTVIRGLQPHPCFIEHNLLYFNWNDCLCERSLSRARHAKWMENPIYFSMVWS